MSPDATFAIVEAVATRSSNRSAIRTMRQHSALRPDRHGRTSPVAPVEDVGVPRDRVRDCDSSAWLAGLGFLRTG